MNARWNEHRRRMEAPRKAEPAPRPARQKKQKKATASERFACVQRSVESFAKLDCNCHDKPEVFDCSVHGMCILAATAKRLAHDKGHVMHSKDALHSRGPSSMAKYEPWFREGDAVNRGEIEGRYRLAVCELCDARQAPESTPAVEQSKTAEPFPLASDETAAARVVICRACDKREVCGKPETAARWALEACPDGRWRAEQ